MNKGFVGAIACAILIWIGAPLCFFGNCIETVSTILT